MDLDIADERLLKELGEGETPVEKNIAFLQIAGIIYMLGFVYLLYSRFISDIHEDLIYLAQVKSEESGSSITYCILNSMSVLILCFISMFKSESDLGVSVVLGGDMYHIGILYAIIVLKIILKKKKANTETRYLDAWIFLRDMVMYLIGLGCLTLFLYMDSFEWWMASILILYTIAFFVIIQKNEILKNKIYRMVGLTHEDDSFNADDQIKQVKKSIPIELLKQNGFIKPQAEDLKKRIAKNEGLIIMKHGNKEDKRAKILMKWHAAVYTIMFAIKNKHKYEKEQRSKFYAEKWRERDDDLNDFCYSKESQDEIQEENNSNELTNLTQQQKQLNLQQQDQLLQNNNNQQNDKNNDSQDDDDDDDNDSSDEIQEITMKFPQGGISRLSYFIFFPFHLILFLIPNYHKDPTLMKLLRSYIITIILLGFTLYLIDWWCYDVAVSLDIPIELIGYVGVSFGLSLPYIVYNLKIAKKEEESVEFFQSFVEVGVYKLGVCVGLPMLFNCLLKLKGSVTWVTVDGLKHLCASQSILVFLIVIFILINKFKIDQAFGYFLVCFNLLLILLGIVLVYVKL